MDWWDNPKKESERVLKKLREVMEGKNTHPTEPVVESVPDLTPSDTVNDIEVDLTEKLEYSVPAKKTIPVYIPAGVETFVESGASDESAFAKRIIRNILAAEAPVTYDYLSRRLMTALGYARGGTKINAFIDGIISAVSPKITTAFSQKTVWQSDQTPGAYTSFRVSGDDS